MTKLEKYWENSNLMQLISPQAVTYTQNGNQKRHQNLNLLSIQLFQSYFTKRQKDGRKNTSLTPLQEGKNEHTENSPGVFDLERASN